MSRRTSTPTSAAAVLRGGIICPRPRPRPISASTRGRFGGRLLLGNCGGWFRLVLATLNGQPDGREGARSIDGQRMPPGLRALLDCQASPIP